MTNRERDRTSWWRRRSTAVAAGVFVVVGVVVVVAAMSLQPHVTAGERKSPATVSATATPAAPFVALSAGQVSALPEAKYNAVIPGLAAYDRVAPASAATTYTLTADTPIYAADKRTPVARFAGKNFLNDPTVVTPMQVSGDWALVLTPARRTLPSTSGGHAAPQTAGWVRTSSLHNPTSLKERIVVSVSKQTLTITGSGMPQEFQVGVGASGTPTPTGVSGYLQARYLDPAQNQTIHPIQLTSLHSAAADEPYSGTDGGLIMSRINGS